MTTLAPASYYDTKFPNEYKNVISSGLNLISDTPRIFNSSIRNAQRIYELSQLEKCFNSLYELKTWSNNWDSYGAKKPKIKSIEKAKKFLSALFHKINQDSFEWLNPNITADSDGEIVFEWWNKNKTLVIYISNNDVSYVKAHSPEIEEMEDGCLDDKLEKIKSIWAWLNY